MRPAARRPEVASAASSEMHRRRPTTAVRTPRRPWPLMRAKSSRRCTKKPFQRISTSKRRCLHAPAARRKASVACRSPNPFTTKSHRSPSALSATWKSTNTSTKLDLIITIIIITRSQAETSRRKTVLTLMTMLLTLVAESKAMTMTTEADEKWFQGEKERRKKNFGDARSSFFDVAECVLCEENCVVTSDV